MSALDRLIEAVEAGEWDGKSAELTFPNLQYAWAHMAFDGSLDAALSLFEALLPGEGWSVGWVAKYPALAGKPAPYVAEVGWGERVKAYADTPARALLIAVLKAHRAALDAPQEAEE